MPDYKLKNGEIVTVKEEDVQSFMSSKHGDGAVLIEAKETKPVKTKAVATETAPVTAVNEAVDTDLASENGSSEPLSNEQASFNYEQRTGNKPGSIMDLTDDDYKATNIVADFMPVDNNKVFSENRARIAQIQKDREELESKATLYSYNNMPGLESVEYVKDQLDSFDEASVAEIKIMENNPEFKLRNDAIHQLSKNTGNNKATGDSVDDLASEFSILNLFKGRSYYKNQEASEIVSLNKSVENAVVSKLDNKQLQKLAGGFYTLEEKENLIKEVKIPIVKKKIEQIKNLNLESRAIAEAEIESINKSQEAVKKSISDLTNGKMTFDKNSNATKEQINEYNSLVETFNGMKDQGKSVISNYNKQASVNDSTLKAFEGDYGVDLAIGTINNKFKLSDDAEKFREKYAGDGFWNATADIAGGSLVQGLYQMAKKGTVGATTWALTSFGDAFQDQDNYSSFDAFSDVVDQWGNKTLLPSSTSEKFNITKEEGGFKDFEARNYAKLGVSMVPFTAYLISEVRKGNFKGLKEAVGNTYMKLGAKGKVLAPASQKLKDNIIMMDATFRATIMDNQKEGEKLGLNGLQASSYATVKSSTEAMVQMIMPDSQFLKGIEGKAIKDAFVGSLKKVATKEGLKTAGKQYLVNIGKEMSEEQLNAGVNLVTNAAYGIALPKASEFMNSQIELIAGTIMLSGGMGLSGSAKTFSNQKKLIYNQIKGNIASVDLQLTTMAQKVKDPEIKKQLTEARQFALDIHKAIDSSPENVTSDQIDLLLKKQKLISKKKTTDTAFHPAINDKIKLIDSQIETSGVKRDIANKFDKDINNVSKSLNSTGIKVDETIIFDDDIDGDADVKMKDFLIKNAPSDIADKGPEAIEKWAEESKNNYGTFITTAEGKEVLIVNKQSALKDSFVTTGQHEFLHKVLKAALNSKPELIRDAGSLLLNEVESMIKNEQGGGELDARIKSYRKMMLEGDLSVNDFFEEILPLFSEAITRKDVKLNKSSLDRIGDYFRQVFQNIGIKNIKFDSAEGVKNFIVDYNKAFSKGSFKGKLKDFAKGDKDAVSSKVDSKTTFRASKSVSDLNQELERLDKADFDYDDASFNAAKSNLEFKIRAAKKKEASKPKKRTEFDIGPDSPIGKINALIPKEIKTQEQFKAATGREGVVDPISKGINKALAPNGIISNMLTGRGMSTEQLEGALVSIRGRWKNYNPAAPRKTDSKVPITFGEWVMSNANFGTKDAKENLAVAAADRKNKTDLDNKEAQSIANEESSEPTADNRKKYASLISNTKMIPSFVVNEIKTKLVDITSKLTSKLSTRPKGANAQTTPLIAEIKKAIGNVVKDPKALPKQLIDRMGNPKDGSYQTYLIDSKKSILENMTTTYLQTAIPNAIEKSVGGTYVLDNDGKRKKDSNGNDIFKPNFVPYSEWKGKKIDREKVSTNKKGGTSGNEIVRRAIQVENKEGKFEDSISNEDFVANFVGSDGKVIRGKRESLGKALAEEAGFEVLTKELANENSDIRKAFKENQTALNEVLVDNFVEQISRDAERGTVKFSLKAIELEVVSDIVDGINTEEFKNRFFMHANDPNNERPLYTSLVAHFEEFRIEGLKIGDLKTIAAQLSKDYTFKPFGEIGIKRVQEAEGVLKTLKYIQENTKEGLTRGNSYATAQQIIDGVDIKLDTKTLLGINEGREAAKKVVDVLAAKGFTGNEIKNIFVAIYSPSGLGGFKGKLNKDGKTRATPNSIVLVKDDLGKVNYKKDKETEMPTTQVEDRGSFMVSVADFEQNFLKGIEMGDKVSTRTDAYTKNFWSKDKSAYNKLDNEGKKAYLQELQEGKKEYQASLITFIEALNKADISSAAQRTLSRSPFAAMDGLGKITSAPRWMPARLDGTLLSLKDLVKLGFGRKDGKVDKGVFEHTKPANRVAIAAYIYSMTGKKADLDILTEELSDFDTAFITEGMDKGLVRNKLQSLMGLNYIRGAGVMTTRYAEMIQEMNKAGVTFYDAKTNTLLSPAGALGAQLNQEMKANLAPVKTEQKAINNARSNKWSKSIKKIRVFDFDDTLARTKSNVLYTMPDGTTGKIDAATFAKDAGKMEAEGAQWDFSEFSKVMDGKKGPLFEVAKIIADKRGSKDVFVLTARPADAAGPIQEFLSELGLDIPLENITGLGNGTPKAKADWVVGKVADGYNDFYFADDHTGNVKAVKNALDTFDVKGKVQLAKVKFSKGLDAGFNSMIQRQKGVESFKEFSRATAKRRGKKTGKWKFFVSPSAEDFRGLTQYKFAGKGKQGEADQKFFEESLMDPYFQGVAALESARQVIKDDTKALLSMFKPVKKKLNKLIKGEQYTYDAAVRVYLWNKAGNEIPGLSKRDNKKLNDIVVNDPELSSFADGLLTVSKKDSWPEPGEHWLAQTTLSDLNNLTEKANRKEYLTEFIENVDIVFSEKNLNKVEALYGEASRKAIENAISAMKSGSNSSNQGGDAITSKWTNWVNNSIGTIMFFNRRSAILQTLSSANFINWSDNNPAKAALAFANQPQYWKDFAMIFNSNKLKQRRGGLKSDVQEAEIANAAKNTQDKAGAIIAYILKLGFTPTQIADSFAISLGGASMYRNRVKTYTKDGMDLKDAETKAFQDFSKLSDEAQQSGDPALVSQQQRSVAGRLILSFQNTTMQYTRLMKKSGQDLVNGRGDAKTHISKILYFGAVQNFLFNALSKTAFALIPGFDEDEEDDKDKKEVALEKKAADILNGMSDSVVRGTGIYGAIFTTLKNSYAIWKKEDEKGFRGDQTKTILELANLSPAIGSKLRKVYSGIQTYQFDKAVIEKHPWSVTIDGKFNPSSTYSILANVGSAGLNLPLDRALAEAKGVAEMLDARNSVFQRIALGLGWRTWNVGAKNEEFDLIKAESKKPKTVSTRTVSSKSSGSKKGFGNKKGFGSKKGF